VASLLQALAWVCDEVALLTALLSPLDRLGGTLLTAHMAQHGVLITVVPLLLLLGAPGAAFVWGLPIPWRLGLLRSRPWRLIVELVNALSRPMQATCLHALMNWIWHAPAPFQAALSNEWIHSLEHASCFVSAPLLWPRSSTFAARAGSGLPSAPRSEH
jgi:putative membrane protein